MTATDTIESLQRELDERPDDWFLREVLADALDDVGSSLGPGYRAMGRCKKTACDSYGKTWVPRLPCSWFHAAPASQSSRSSYFHLPVDWFDLLHERQAKSTWTRAYPNRRAAEDAAASVFPQLPPEVQARYLRGELE